MESAHHPRRLWFAVVIAGLATATAADAKPRIAILATGGTIAGAQADTKQARYQCSSSCATSLR